MQENNFENLWRQTEKLNVALCVKQEKMVQEVQFVQ